MDKALARAIKSLFAVLVTAAMVGTTVTATALPAVVSAPTAVASAEEAVGGEGSEAPASHGEGDDAHDHGDESTDAPAHESVEGDETVTVSGTVSELPHAPGAYMLAVVGSGFLPVALDGVEASELGEMQSITLRVPAGFAPASSSSVDVFAALEQLVLAQRGTVLAVVQVLDRPTVKSGENTANAITPKTHKVWAVSASPHGGDETAHASQTQAKVQASIDHANTFWQAQSGNRISVELQTYGGFYKSAGAPGYPGGFYCDSYESGLLWNEMAKKVGFTYGSYKHLALFFAEGFNTSVCEGGGAIGLGHIGSKVSSGGAVWVVGTDAPMSKATLVHELGHNFSFGHANIAGCDSGVPNWFHPVACAGYYPYWDAFDVMGYGLTGITGGAISSPGAIRAGIWDTVDYHVASTGKNSYSINSVSTNAGKRAIVITDPITKEKYYVELRTYTGSDAQLSTATGPSSARPWLNQGVRILQTSKEGYSHQTFLLPSGPQTAASTPKNTFYTLGGSFTTRSSGTTITVTAYNAAAGTATVEVIVRGSSPSTPVITGTPKYNSTLTTNVDDWLDIYPGTTNHKFQWYRSGKAIKNATSTSYTLTSSDIGKTITVKATAKLGVLNKTVSKTSAKTAKVAALTITSQPVTATGTQRVGETLTASHGAWTQEAGGTHPLTVSYQWYRSGKAIKNAKSQTYTPTSSDRGKTITVKVTGKSTGYPTVSQTSPKTAKIDYGIIAGSLGGSANLDTTTMTLTAVATGVTETGVKTSYQWMRDGKKINKATKASYKLTSSDRQKLISVVITVKKTGYTTKTFTTTPTSYTTTASTSLPQLNQPWAAELGATLSLQARTYAPGSAQTYQWLRNGKSIKNATSSTYTVTSADIGKQLSVTVTSTLTGTLPHISTSAKTEKIGTSRLAGALTASAARTAPDSTTLEATSAGITTEGVTTKYQWLRDGKAISKATKSTYKLTSSDRGKNISVRITVSKKSHTTQVAYSTPTNYTVAVSGVPTLGGTTAVGQTLTGTFAASTPVGATRTYQWLRNGKAISGATSTSYTLTASDRGKAISVRATYSSPGYLDQTVTGAKTTKIAYGTITPQGAISMTAIGGDPNSTLYAVNTGTWQAGVTFSYQWYYNNKAVSKATKATYSRKGTHDPTKVKVKVTAKLSGYTTVTQTVPYS